MGKLLHKGERQKKSEKRKKRGKLLEVFRPHLSLHLLFANCDNDGLHCLDNTIRRHRLGLRATEAHNLMRGAEAHLGDGKGQFTARQRRE